MSPYRRALGPGFGEGAEDREVDEEIEAHLSMRAEALMRERGLDPQRARAEAERRFGEHARARRSLAAQARANRRRRGRRERWRGLKADVRLSFRRARRSPGFTAAAVLIFTVSVGLWTSVASVADHVLARPLPFPEPERLVALWSVGSERTDFPWVSMSNWADWRAARSLESAGLYRERLVPVLAGDEAVRASAVEAAGSFFSTVRATMLHGRGFTEEEAQSGAPLVVLEERFAERVFGDADALGAPLLVDGVSMEVIGVVRKGEALPGSADLWVPLPYRAGSGALRNNINYRAVARLAPGVSVVQARAELDGIAERIRETDPEALYSWGVGVRTLHSVVVGSARNEILLLGTAVGLLLALASANLAGLSLARARRRDREIAVRQALGAGRIRIARQAICDHLVPAAVGGSAGVLLGAFATRAYAGRVAAWLPRTSEIDVDLRVVVLGLSAALLAGVLSGLLPAIHQSSRRPSAALSGARAGVPGGRNLPGATVVGGQIALALVILISTGLLLRSYASLVQRELGFVPEGVLTADVALSGDAWEGADDRLSFWRALEERLSALPGVQSASVTSAIPTGDGARGFIDLPDRIGEPIGAGYFVVGHEYFRALGVPVLRGRAFDESDRPGTMRVTVVNESMASEFWPGRDPVGAQVRARSMEGFDGSAPWLTVIGVVADTRQYGFASEPEPDMFVLHDQVPYYTREMTVVARTAGATNVDEALRAAVRSFDSGIAVEVVPLLDRLEAGTADRRAMLLGLGFFGVVAVLLVCLGIYALISFAAEGRTREMAIRRALGAERSGVVGLMLVGALRVIAAGTLIGLLGVGALGRLLRGHLIETAPTDPLTYLLATALLVGVGVAAALVPSLRSTRRDPMTALGSDQ